MFLKIYPENPNPKHIKQVVDCLQDGGIIVYPTDTVYGLGCNIYNQKAVARVAQIKGADPAKDNFSFVCYDMSHLADFTLPISNQVYKLMRRNLPGPFTFVLPANNNVPKLFRSKKKTVGIRIPDNSITREIVRLLDNPIMSTSIHDNNEVIEYTTDPELIYDIYKDSVDIVIDGGYSQNTPSTVVDCTSDSYQILRQSKFHLNQ